jgi:hypothetical protein
MAARQTHLPSLSDFRRVMVSRPSRTGILRRQGPRVRCRRGRHPNPGQPPGGMNGVVVPHLELGQRVGRLRVIRLRLRPRKPGPGRLSSRLERSWPCSSCSA